MAPTLTVLLLSCWLAGRSGMSGDPVDSEDEFSTVGTSCGSGDGIQSEPSGPVIEAPEPSAAPGPRNIIAGVSAAATGLLLLLLAFLCYRRTRGRKGPALRQSRESKATSTIYALVGEGKQRDVLPQETDPGVEGLTYAELDGRVLQAK